MGKLYNKDGTFTKEGEARFLNADGTLTKEAEDMMHALTDVYFTGVKVGQEHKEAIKLEYALLSRTWKKIAECEKERKETFLNALEEVVAKEPDYKVYKEGNISYSYDKYRRLFFCFSIEDQEKRIYLYSGEANTQMYQIKKLREYAYVDIRNMIKSLDYGKNDLNPGSWVAYYTNVSEIRPLEGEEYNHLQTTFSRKPYLFHGTKKAYRMLIEWKILMIAYDRLLEWISNNEDKIKEVIRQLNK